VTPARKKNQKKPKKKKKEKKGRVGIVVGTVESMVYLKGLLGFRGSGG
jgi:hypothetical protein